MYGLSGIGAPPTGDETFSADGLDGSAITIERFSIPVETRAPTGATNAYLLTGEATLLVDPAAQTDELTDRLATRPPDHIVVTHTHADHVGAVWAYATMFDATVWGLVGRTERFLAATGRLPDRTFHPGDTIGPATVLTAPGHAPDHVCFLLDSACVVGDLAVATGSVFIGPEDGDMRGYLTSLRRLHTYDLDRLYPGHGPVITDSRETLARLITHRLDRERRIEVAVANGAETPAAIVSAAYEKDLSGVRDLAERTVRAHLEKLAVEGTVFWDGQRARPLDG